MTPMTHCNEHLQVTLYELKDNLCDSLCHTSTAMLKIFSSVFLFLCFIFYLGRKCKDRGQAQRDGEMSGIEMYDVKSAKNQ